MVIFPGLIHTALKHAEVLSKFKWFSVIYTGLLDWTIHWTAGLDDTLDCWTGLQDWTTGLDCWTGWYTGLLDWTTEVDYWTSLDYMLYLPPPAYCTIIKTMVGNLGWPDSFDSFQVNLCMGSTIFLKNVVSHTLVAVSRIATVVLPLQRWNKVSALKGHCIYSREFLWGDFF